MPQKASSKTKQVPDARQRRITRTGRDQDDLTDTGDATDGDDWTQNKSLLKPDDQLDLTEAELKEEFTRILTANNPHAPQNIVRYSFKDRQYKQTSHVDQLAVHFVLDGNMIYKDSDEARRQMISQDTGTVQETDETGETVVATTDREDTFEKEAEDRDETTPVPVTATEVVGKKLTNQFNFSERASQTYNNPYRDRSTATEPPPRVTFKANATQWEIYDAYLDDFDKQEKSKDKKSTQVGRKDEEKLGKKITLTESTTDDLSKIGTASKIVERMVNQNSFDDIAQDFKYWEDIADDYRETEGTVLPLWKFSYEKAKKLAVTAVSWNPKYKDLFAASYGSYDFMKQTNGLIVFYTLKNPTFPEGAFETDSGVMCLDIHPDHPYEVAAGFYDGSVAVFNTVEKKDGPVHRSTARAGKHREPVWQVRWRKDDADSNMNFFSVSSDGRIVKWTVVKTELLCQEVIQLVLTDGPADGPDGIKVPTAGCGTAIDFHKQKEYLFLVGTEEGMVHVCSTAYTSHFMDTSNAHSMAVYKVVWNHYHPNIFATCSADWSVKIWEYAAAAAASTGDSVKPSLKKPLFSFDLNNSVSDVAWAPYSSSVFAAATVDGKVYVFDLNLNKYEPLCQQMVAQKKKTRLTHISFNTTYPVIIVGDDRGNVTSLKLSPNLRKVPKEKKGQPPMDRAQRVEYEINKLNKILCTVREQPTVPNQ